MARKTVIDKLGWVIDIITVLFQKDITFLA